MGEEMTKQEEIREGIAREYMAATGMEYREGDGKRSIFVDQILAYLHSQGCVLKVERELPSYRNAVNKSYNDYMLGQEDMLKAGFGAFEPLIAGKK